MTHTPRPNTGPKRQNHEFKVHDMYERVRLQDERERRAKRRHNILIVLAAGFLLGVLISLGATL